ncbi:putative glutathione S-transferase, N-terminal domain [Lyophyllum shimeji]|uniref:Glutathione S-transferase, N-terminal domain n=1 Tax=Lyophyllum shimeji TaxID=47721 RepID=A0A9P3PE25_LYOSH|nr:putative glutathione S-transferase, N-terminal domain [Lyophyllum shimeji]
MSSSPVILYRYDASPYARKIDNVLALKNVPHNKVNVSSMLPRPEITDLLGITYRRIPILAIGNDVYCDTSLIVSVLERRFPTSAGYSTIFPRSKRGGSRDTGATKIFSKLFVAALFPFATAFIAWEKLPQAFIQDRSALFGTPIDVSQVVATREKSITTVSAYLVRYMDFLKSFYY